MREIKFRAWDLETKEMNPWDLFKEEWLYPNPVYIPMQYTGLKDNNDKEIYEGDIVIIKDFEEQAYRSNVSGPLVVAYSGGGFEVTPDEPLSIFVYEEYEITVIGNIYENPELLNK